MERKYGVANGAAIYAQQGLPKLQFLQEYVLCRAQGHAGGMEGDYVAREAIKAWNVIEAEMKVTK